MADWLWIDFANSDCRDPLDGTRRDRLDDPDWVARLAAKWGLDGLGAADRQALAGLRAAILKAVQAAIAGKRIGPRPLAAVNAALAHEAVTQKLVRAEDGYRLELAQPRGPRSPLRAIAESFARFLVEEDLARLKCCENPDCRWVFHDETRSRTRRWCASSCGNLIRVREFRERRHEGRKGG